jgi:transcriptional regulator with GAF, ATPase, and Fis domain
MATLRIQIPGQGPKVYTLYKRLTSIGRLEENDVSLPDPLLPGTFAQILFDGSDYQLSTLEKRDEVAVNGKKRKKHKLVNDDRIRIGDAELTFLFVDPAIESEALVDTPPPPPPTPTGALRSELATYSRLYDFSARLMDNYDLGELLAGLMDAVLATTGGDKGFLILCEGERMDVKIARNVKKENIANALSQVSDSIISKVVRTRKPVLVMDALSDAEFQASTSVMNLRLSAVLCLPLLERGNLLGLIYVGFSNALQHTERFAPSELAVLEIFASQASLIIRNALLVNELRLDNKLLSDRLERMRFGSIIGSCPAMQDVFRMVGKVASTDISVLITGETGTGKELIAREIHQRSSRIKGPFITINCGAIPENLLESELFGHVRGAFTGAVANKAGKFQAADGGTLLLDEIGEMPLALQVKLLRVLQDRVVVRVGDTRQEPIDIRVVAATNRDLEKEMAAGRFREDLFFRLNVLNIRLPPLRERGDDTIVIAKYMLNQHAEQFGGQVKGFTAAAIQAIKKYRWPGNIRELDNRIKKAVVLADRALLGAEDLGFTADNQPVTLPLAKARELWQRNYVNEVLALNNGNRTKAAQDLGVDPRTIFRYLVRLEGRDERGDGDGVEGDEGDIESTEQEA